MRRKTLAQKDRESEANIERCSTAGISEDVVWEPICEALSTTVAAHNTDEHKKGRENMSWKPEVFADSSGKWAGNSLRFATKEEAEGNVKALASKWFLVTDTRVVECDDPVNYRWIDRTP